MKIYVTVTDNDWYRFLSEKPEFINFSYCQTIYAILKRL